MQAQHDSNANTDTNTGAGAPDSLEAVLARHDRELVAFKSLSDPQQARFQVEQRIHYAQDPWSFLRDCVLTLDPVNQDHPIKPFPSYLQYLEFLCRLWQLKRQIAIPKSRRMVCSWNFIALYTWDTIFNAGRHNAFVSKKEDDAGDLISRAEFIFNKIPAWRIPRALLPTLKNGKMSKQPPLMEFEEINSKLQGFPQGADQMRQFTLSGILGDECAFWDQAQAFYSASRPTLEGGGSMTLISSRSPGFFKKIVFDQLDALDLTFREIPPAPILRPMEGVEMWENPRNRFTVVDLHYTANPSKRGEAWKEAVRSSMPARDFAMEYERSWQTFEGKPVYADFNRTLHVSTGALSPEPGIPLLIGWDFGLCYDAATEVLTASGWKLFKDVNIETDTVFTMNPETRKTYYEQPAGKVDLPFTGELLNWESQSLSATITPDHIVPHWTDNDTFKRKHAHELDTAPGHSKLALTGDWDGTAQTNPLDLDSDTFSAFMGLWLSEGSVDRKTNRVTVYQVKNSAWVTAILERTPYTWRQGADCWHTSDAQLATYLRNFGTQKFRYVPLEIRMAPQTDIQTFLKTYTLGDGHRRIRTNGSEEHTIYSTSKRMIDDLQELGQKLGKCALIREISPTQSYYEKEDRIIHSSGGYSISFNSWKFSEIRAARRTRIAYSGRVYCLSVEHATLFVRKNGKAHWNGNTPACILGQLVGRQLRIIREFVETNGSISKLTPIILNYLQTNHPAWLQNDDQITHYVDPAGFQRAQTDERTCIDVMRTTFGQTTLIYPGPVNWESRRKAVEDYLTKIYGEGPGLIVTEDCPILIEGFSGGYQYPEKAIEIEPSQIRPLKNKFSHPHDALQYLCAGATALRKAYRLDLPTPSYGFTTG